MKNKIICWLLPALLAAGGATAQQQTDDSRRSAEEAARAALRSFAVLVTQQNFKALGFDSLQEVSSATLGTPLQQFMIRLDELQKFTAATDPAQLLHSTETFTFPVLVQERTKSSVTVRKQNGRWESESLGGPSYARLLTEVRDRLAAEGPADLFEVRVPALNLAFVGQRKGSELFLTPIQSDPRFKLEKGRGLPAREVLQALQPIAQKHDGLPT